MYDYAPLNPALITSILLQSEPFLFVQRVERRRVRGAAELGSEKCERILFEEQEACLLKLTRSDSSLPE